MHILKAFFILLIPFYSHSENRVILDSVQVMATYLLHFQPDSTDPELVRNEKVILHIGNQMSYSQSLNGYLLDSIVDAAKDWSILNQFHLLPKSAFDFRVFKNHPTGKITTADKVFLDDYIYTEPLDVFQWEVFPDQKEILGYTTYLAETNFGGRNWNAWFAPEIPISDGPYKFRGLPGMIIRIEDTKGHYKFELVDMANLQDNEQKKIIFSQRNYIDVNKEGFFKAMKSYRDSARNRLLSVLVDPDPETIRRAEQNLRRSNNPIELKAD